MPGGANDVKTNRSIGSRFTVERLRPVRRVTRVLGWILKYRSCINIMFMHLFTQTMCRHAHVCGWVCSHVKVLLRNNALHSEWRYVFSFADWCVSVC